MGVFMQQGDRVCAKRQRAYVHAKCSRLSVVRVQRGRFACSEYAQLCAELIEISHIKKGRQLTVWGSEKKPHTPHL